MPSTVVGQLPYYAMFGAAPKKRKSARRRKPIKLDKSHMLSSSGYSTQIADASRRRAILRRLSKRVSMLTIARALNARAVLLKNRSPASSRRFRADAKYMFTLYRRSGGGPRKSTRSTSTRSKKRRSGASQRRRVSLLISIPQHLLATVRKLLAAHGAMVHVRRRRTR